jgi:hypothetical protein
MIPPATNAVLCATQPPDISSSGVAIRKDVDECAVNSPNLSLLGFRYFCPATDSARPALSNLSWITSRLAAGLQSAEGIRRGKLGKAR